MQVFGPRATDAIRAGVGGKRMLRDGASVMGNRSRRSRGGEELSYGARM